MHHATAARAARLTPAAEPEPEGELQELELTRGLTAMNLRGAPIEAIVQFLAEATGRCIVVENLSRELLAVHGAEHASIDPVVHWQFRASRRDRSAVAADRRAGSESWVAAPIEARGLRWGTVIALPGTGGAPDFVRSAVESGAAALAIDRMTQGSTRGWERSSAKQLVDTMLRGAFSSSERAAQRLEASGFPVFGRNLSGLAIVADRPDDLGDALGDSAEAVGMRAMATVVDRFAVAFISLDRAEQLGDERIAQLVSELGRRGGRPISRVTACLGTPAHTFEELVASTKEALDLARTLPRPTQFEVRRVHDSPLTAFVAAMRDDPRLMEHSERMLAPLIEYDRTRDGDLMTVLRAAIEHPGNRTAAAAACHLSRSVFYQRLSVISELLGRRIEDGEMIAALQLAMTAAPRAGRF
ncbi:hypothetical protein ASE14_16040 [Agromyces sp. Root81]|uniref:PucR family transcriptional regulator n=1 Tax=Agromyces sp. Root81 TaxID=1736601 RepID=UPI000701AED5|nr:PucR family transcriptional regulator [Agromyces sp. Root81]KRC59269.1 hypothetical protein ASE14_16040 [Agromyces sp. Root81]